MTNKIFIVKDSREQKGWDFKEDPDFCKGTIIEKIDFGDYSIAGLEQNILVLERKSSPGEIHNNALASHFQKYLDNIINFKYKYMVMEFGVDELLSYPWGNGLPKNICRKIRINGKFLLSYLTKISIEYNINLIFAGSPKNAEKIAYQILKQVYKKEIESKCQK